MSPVRSSLTSKPLGKRTSTQSPPDLESKGLSRRSNRYVNRSVLRRANALSNLTPALQSAALDSFVPRPSHLRYLRAWLDLLAEKGEVTVSRLAEKLDRSRQAVYLLKAQYPHLDAWCARQIRMELSSDAAFILKRIGSIALRTGSPKHAEIFLKATGDLRPDWAVDPMPDPNFKVTVVGIPLAGDVASYPGGYLPDVVPPPKQDK